MNEVSKNFNDYANNEILVITEDLYSPCIYVDHQYLLDKIRSEGKKIEDIKAIKLEGITSLKTGAIKNFPSLEMIDLSEMSIKRKNEFPLMLEPGSIDRAANKYVKSLPMLDTIKIPYYWISTNLGARIQFKNALTSKEAMALNDLNIIGVDNSKEEYLYSYNKEFLSKYDAIQKQNEPKVKEEKEGFFNKIKRNFSSLFSKENAIEQPIECKTQPSYEMQPERQNNDYTYYNQNEVGSINLSNSSNQREITQENLKESNLESIEGFDYR